MYGKPKYYTPTIEEFHIGFEYEELLLGTGEGYQEAVAYTEDDPEASWFKKVFEVLSPSSWEDFKHSIRYEVYNTGYTRVKYLDKEDIESLGFEHIGSGWYEKGGWRIRKWAKKELDVYELFSGEWDRVFRGKHIKNKSELEKLLIQLSV